MIILKQVCTGNHHAVMQASLHECPACMTITSAASKWEGVIVISKLTHLQAAATPQWFIWEKCSVPEWGRKTGERDETGIQQKETWKDWEGKHHKTKKKSIKTIKEDRLVEPEIRETRSGSNVSSLNDYWSSLQAIREISFWLCWCSEGGGRSGDDVCTITRDSLLPPSVHVNQLA